MTTDQDLIKDGVQAIGDEFLEWFVKNPSCEEVEIESWQTKGEWDLDYKIIIPKEEPKQIKCYCGHTIMCDCSPLDENKQQTLEETLEEAAHKMLMDYGIMSVGESINVLNVKKLMVLFAKWQQERSYSEEDMEDYAEYKQYQLSGKNKSPKEWFEQFKNKINELRTN